MSQATRQDPDRAPRPDSALVELLVVLLLIGLLAVWGYPSFLGTLNRLRLVATAREAAVFMQIARMEAAKRALPTRVVYQDTSGLIGKPSLLAYADLDSDGSFQHGERPGDRRPVSAPDRYLALGSARNVARRHERHQETGARCRRSTTAGRRSPATCSVDSVGAFRFRDRNGNFLETRSSMPHRQGQHPEVVRSGRHGRRLHENGEGRQQVGFGEPRLTPRAAT
jgi:type II secretory pathway pseudopilin PulG